MNNINLAEAEEESARWNKNSNNEPLSSSLSSRSIRSRTPGCCATILVEWNPCQDWYSVRDTVTGRKLDVQHTFGPIGRYTLLLKLLGTGFCISTLIYSLIDTISSSSSDSNDNNTWFYWFYYYSNWNIIFSCIYQILSFFNSLFTERITQPPERVTGCCKATWILFTISSNSNLLAIIFYWVLIYIPNKESLAITYLNIASHGGVALVVILDGLLINRIPLRWMHFWVWVLLYNMLYITWTIIQSDLVLDIGIPSNGDSEEQDTAIYYGLSWSDDWQKALIYSIIILFAISPAIYTFLWLLSLYGLTFIFCCWGCNDQRRYVDSHLDKLRNDEDKKKKQAAKNKKKNNNSSSSRVFDPSVEGGDVELEEVSIFASVVSPHKQ